MFWNDLFKGFSKYWNYAEIDISIKIVFGKYPGWFQLFLRIFLCKICYKITISEDLKHEIHLFCLISYPTNHKKKPNDRKEPFYLQIFFHFLILVNKNQVLLLINILYNRQ